MSRSAREIGSAVAERRRELGLSQEQLAAKVGIARATIQNIEAGRTRKPHGLDRIAEALDVPLWELTGRPRPGELDRIREAVETVDYLRNRPSTQVERAILDDPELTDEERVRYLRMLYDVRGKEWPVNQSGERHVNHMD